MLANLPRAGLFVQTLGGVYSGVSVIPEAPGVLRARADTARNRLILHERSAVRHAPHAWLGVDHVGTAPRMPEPGRCGSTASGPKASASGVPHDRPRSI